MAYSPKHRKIVAVGGKDTFVYDFPPTSGARPAPRRASTPPIPARLRLRQRLRRLPALQTPQGRVGQGRTAAFDLKTGKWRSSRPRARAVPTDCRKGYYDPEHNCCGRRPGPFGVPYKKKVGQVRQVGPVRPSDGPSLPNRRPPARPSTVPGCSGRAHARAGLRGVLVGEDLHERRAEGGCRGA